MINRTNEEIMAFVQKLFDEESKKNYLMGWKDEGCINIDKNEPEHVAITINCMYEAPSPTLAVLKNLAEFFGTENINDDDHFANGGCETCDYGSSHGYTLKIRPEATK